MDKFDAMRVFVRVVESGTFTKASETLNLQKATVTRLVKMLEDDLATKLLNRTTRRVTVTPDGAAYYDRAVHLLADLEELESSMSGARSHPKGRLRINLPRRLAHSVVVPALPDFLARYPDIDLEIGASDMPVDLFADNVDCAIRVGIVTDQSLVARRIALSHFELCASPEYWKKHGKPHHPSEIDLHHTVIHMISARTARPFPFIASRGSETFDIQGRKALLCNDVSTCTDLARTGLGIISGGTFMTAPLIASGDLESCLAHWQLPPMPVSIVHPPNRHISNKVRVFADWVIELFARHPSQKSS